MDTFLKHAGWFFGLIIIICGFYISFRSSAKKVFTGLIALDILTAILFLMLSPSLIYFVLPFSLIGIFTSLLSKNPENTTNSKRNLFILSTISLIISIFIISTDAGLSNFKLIFSF